MEEKVFETREIVSELPNDQQAPKLYALIIAALFLISIGCLISKVVLSYNGLDDSGLVEIALVAVGALAATLGRKVNG